MLSVAAGFLGLLVTYGGIAYFGADGSRQRPHLYWVLGLVALLPAWLIGFVSLLGSSTREKPEPSISVSFILTVAAALFGVIVMDSVVRGLAQQGRARSVTCWLLGVATLFPAWCIALLALFWTRP